MPGWIIHLCFGLGFVLGMLWGLWYYSAAYLEVELNHRFPHRQYVKEWRKQHPLVPAMKPQTQQVE